MQHASHREDQEKQEHHRRDDGANQAKIFHDVFISYSRRDGAFVRKLSDALETTGRDAWIDWTAIPPRRNG